MEDSEELKRVLEAGELDIQKDISDGSDEEGKSDICSVESDESNESDGEEQKAPKETKGAKIK